MHSERCDCKIRILIRLLLCAFMITGCASAGTGAAAEQATVEQATVDQATVEQEASQAAEQVEAAQATEQAAEAQEAYSYQEYPLERNGISLHLDCMKVENTEPENNILLVHGSTYSSHEFDIDYEDYSLVRRLAREGYAVWRLDIAGYGQSGEVEDGLMPDTAYAAEDIRAAMELIARETGRDRVDLLGWSWGTMTAGLYAAEYPEHLGKLVLYAPILTGIGKAEISEPFNHNDWNGAAEDFQIREDGSFDTEVTDPVLIEMWCSSCWHYDGD